MMLIKKIFDLKNIIKIFYSNRFLFLFLKFFFKMIDILFIKTKNEILFYGYMGRYSGNAASLFNIAYLKSIN